MQGSSVSLAQTRAPGCCRGRAQRLSVRAEASKKTVLVTGAGGRTGKIVLKKLAERDDFQVKGLVRTEKSRQTLAKEFSEDDVELIVGDVASIDDMGKAIQGCNQLVVLSSAKPQIKKRSIVRMFLKKLIFQKPGRPSFRFPNGMPSEVDFIGGKNQINAASSEGLDQVVWVGSMGGTEKDNFLNTIGEGNILLWKRRAEEYLIASGLNYTIIHPGGLLDKPEGKRKIIVGVDDEMLKLDTRSIPRGDVASIVVGCLGLPEAYNISFDLASMPEQEEDVSLDMKDILGSLNGKTCDYDLNKAALQELKL